MASGNDSADDFFNSFDANSPPAKPSKSLKPPSSGNNAPPPPKPKPRPPPPPPPGARQGRAAAGGARAATSTAAATTRAGQTTASTSYYGSSAAAAATASGAAAPGAAAAPAGTSNSYYGQQQQRQQATSLVNRGTAAGQTSQQRQSYHLGETTTTTTAAAPQPAMFNPAAAAPSSAGHTSNYAAQQPTQQPANFYAAAPVSSETPDTSGDWFTPDAPSSTAATDATTATSSAAPTASNPYAQSAMFHSSSSLEGRMDSGAASAMTPAPAPNFAVFTSSSAPSSGNAPRGYNPAEFDNEPPLLEELGINLQHILLKTKAVVIPFKRFSGRDSALLDPALIVEDPDLAGPAAFGLLLGGELLLSGKIHFGYIYGFGVFGCLALTLILNLMTPQKAVSIWTVASILGYSLLPVNVLAAIKLVLVDLVRLETLGQLLALLTILWSTTASTRLLEVGCGMRAQRYLLAYPIALLYSAFVLITIF